MYFKISFVYLLIIASASCTTSPYSKWKAHTPEEDMLTSEEKINFYSEGVNTSSATSYAALAQLYQEQQDWEEALKQIQMAIKEEPMNSYYHSLKSNYAYALKDVSTAYREALTAYQLGTQSLQQSLILAKMAVALSEFSIVNNIIDSLAIVYPNDPGVLYMAARKYDKTGDDDLAESYYGKVLKIDSGYQDNIYHFGDFLARNNRFIEAQSVLSRLSDKELSIGALKLSADIFYNLEQLDTAVALYRREVAINPDTTVYNAIIKIYSSLGELDSLIIVCKQAIVDFPNQTNYKLLTARTLDYRRNYNEALSYYKELYEMDSTDTLIAAELSYLQRKMAYLQRKKDADRKLQDSLQIQQSDSTINDLK